MKNSKLKILLMVVIIGIFTVGMPIFTYAANERAVIVKQSDSEYLIYLKGYLDYEAIEKIKNSKLNFHEKIIQLEYEKFLKEIGE